MTAPEFKGIRVTVMGLGVLGGGAGVARYLAERGAQVTVTDMRGAAELEAPVSELAQWPITYHLGEHDERDFTRERADIVVRNPGVRRESPYLQIARESGVTVEMEMSLFFRACPSNVIGVTGTKGKTTVTALIGEMLRAWDPASFVAGNMGISALEGLSRLTEATPVVIELSSWQLESLDEHRLSPHVAVITNFSEDHLDRYNGYEDYVETKRSIAHHQKASDVVVFNNDDPDVRKVRVQSPARPFPFGTASAGGDGAWIASNGLVSRFDGTRFQFAFPDQLSLSGLHGRLNALAAIAACNAYGVPESAIESGLRSFAGVENRLEDLGTVRGVRFINDTSSTAPVATITSLRLLADSPGRVILITGGADKQSDLTEFLDVIVASVAKVVLLPGAATERVNTGLTARGLDSGPVLNSMADAVSESFAAANPGDTVILSPGLASFGLFRNEFDRGNQFREAVGRIPNEAAT